ncbi:MAG: N-acetylglucosamine-6-phosphate deacetylase [Chloroflexi bacterium]|nr:N-acetylglucosamine-6-phosphate deacetylase [Chloroflexota bacterium]
MISLIGRLLAPEEAGVRLVTVDRGWVASIGEPGDAPPDAQGGPDAWIVPGLVDIQLNGAFGVDFTDPGADLSAAALALPRTGVTAFLPTVVSSPPEAYEPILRNLARPVPDGAARVMGVHIEGPFLARGRRGAHDPGVLRQPDLVEVRGWLDAGNVAIVTLAPELPGAAAVVRELVARGVIAAIGHSDATWDQADAAIVGGARLGTHLFNAMRPLHHREPGIVGRLLAGGVTASLIVDGIHLAPKTIRLVAAIKTPDELVFVTDGLAALGEPPASYRMGSREVISDGIVARLADGTLSGSVAPMAPALGRLVAAGLEPSVAVRAASTTPARLLGLEADLGRVEVGRLADLVLLDAEWRPQLTLVQGRIGHRRAVPQQIDS